MTKFNKLLTVILFVIFLIATLDKKGTKDLIGYNQKYHDVIYFDKNLFIKGINKAELNTETLGFKIKGGIVPHHLLATEIIADFFKKVSTQAPDTIIILGPNHQESGYYKVLGSDYSWKTDFGIVRPNNILINSLLKNNLMVLDETILPSDQSISALMPYISYYLPSVNVVPLLLSSKMTNEDIEKLSKQLGENVKDGKTLLIASVDFSHYLSFDQAQARDLESISAIKKFGCKNLLAFDSQNLDSVSSICTLLYSMLDVGATNIDIVDHSNSYLYQKSGSDFTTSYFSMYFY